jgi:amidase
MSDRTALDASDLAQAIYHRDISCREVMLAYLQRIERLNRRVNAIVSLLETEPLLAQPMSATRNSRAGNVSGGCTAFRSQ